MDNLTFHVESVEPIWNQFENLLCSYWDEVEQKYQKKPLSIKREKYIYYNQNDTLVFYTARNDKHDICGYAGMYILDNNHLDEKLAVEDGVYLLPYFRKGMNALNFYKFIESDLFGRIGVDEIRLTVRPHNQASRSLLKRLKCSVMGTVYHKRK